jgi:hypothetical protein
MALSGEIEKGQGLKGKGRNAFRNLRAVEENINEIIGVLGKLESGLKSITHPEIGPLSNAKSEGSNDQNPKPKDGSEKENNPPCISEIDGIPKRIEFKLINLKFYIDFTLIMAEKDVSSDIKGGIIYGVHKSLCFTNCPNLCEQIERCDGLKDKPLIHFFVDRNGMIQSSGEFEDKWWIKKVNQDKNADAIDAMKEDESLKETLSDLHYRTIELIWPRALNWINENLLT